MSHSLIIAFDPSDVAPMLGPAHVLGMPYDVLLISGSSVEAGANKFMSAALPTAPPADSLADALVPVLANYSHVLLLSSMRSKDLAARLAGVAGIAMVTDVIEIENGTRFKRPIVAGSIIATVEVDATPVIMTVRPSAFPTPSVGSNSQETTVTLNLAPRSERISESKGASGRPDLTQANIVVTGGRPLKDAEAFERIIGGLADALGGAAGATRAAVDSGIAANDLQVGQTGKIVSPELYIAAGVSGSTQHMAGIKDSKIIVAINTDGDAPIFEMADYGLIADLFVALPEIQKKSKK